VKKYEIDSWLIDELCQYESVPVSWPNTNELPSDGLFFVVNGSQSILVERIVTDTSDSLESRQYLLKDLTCWGIVGRSAEQKIALNYLTDSRIPCVSLVGKAGSGKTLLALAAALQQRQDYLKILVARPAVSLGNAHDLGYVPGTLNEKLAPWTMPIFDNLTVLKEISGKETIERMLQEKKIEMCPLQYIRGRSLYRTFLIVDEAQNLRPEEVKAIGTRIGEGSKVCFTGDTDQIDKHYLKYGKDGLSILIQKTKGYDLCASVKLRKGERSPLADLLADIL
jgi:PhoH-like ATPase